MGNTDEDLATARRPQIFPRFNDEEIARLSRFGEPRSYGRGEMVAQAGEVGPGLLLVLSGRLEVRRHDRAGNDAHIITHERGDMMGELAQLSGRPFLIDAVALTAVEAIAIAPHRLRALLITETELGERVMRALILRRVTAALEQAVPTAASLESIDHCAVGNTASDASMRLLHPSRSLCRGGTNLLMRLMCAEGR